MNVIEIATKLLGLVLDIVPRDVAEDLLSKEAIRRQNAIVDAAEAAKFPRG